jgi:hypothetical protein
LRPHLSRYWPFLFLFDLLPAIFKTPSRSTTAQKEFRLRRILVVISLTVPGLLSRTLASQTDLKYQIPPAVMVKVVDAPPPPFLSLSPEHGTDPRMLLIEQRSSLPTIADLAEPELRLAGLRFNPKTAAPSRTRYAISLKLQPLPATNAAEPPKEITISGLPSKLRVFFAEWSPDGQHIAFVNQDAAPNPGLSLWIIDVPHAHATVVPGIRLNAVLSEPITWIDNGSLAVLAMPAHRGAEPGRSEIPTGPVIQENEGRSTPAPTYEDLLKSPSDERVFEYNATSQLMSVKLVGGTRPIGKPGIFKSFDASPDGHYILAETLHKPFSYSQPYYRFPLAARFLLSPREQ